MNCVMKKSAYKYLILAFFTVAVLFSATPSALSYYGFGYGYPSWNTTYNIGRNNWFGGFNVSGYQNVSDPYGYSYAMGLYHPYNSMFNLYNAGYNYNAGSPGYYGTGYGMQNINAMGYPYPYASVNQTMWNDQASYWGAPPVGTGGNVYNVQYDPMAFTVDLGLDAYVTGINNFFQKIFSNQDEDE